LTVRELVTTWGFDIDTKPLQELEHHISGVRDTIRHLGELILGEGASLFGLAETTTNAAVEFKKTAEGVGTTATRIQELVWAGKKWDIQASSITMSLRRLSTGAVEASRGSAQAARTLMEAGVHDMYNDKGGLLRSDQLLLQVAQKFRTMGSDALKAGLAQQVFGRSSSEIITLLNRLGTEGFEKAAAEAHKFGGVMDEEAIKKSEAFKESINTLRAMITGLRNTIGLALMPAIEAMVDDVKAWYIANESMIRSDIVQFAKELSAAVEGIAKFMVHTVDVALRLTSAFGGLGEVMKIITAGFTAWAALGVVSSLTEIIKIVILAAKAMWALATGEAAVSGGLSAIAQIAAAAAVGGTALYMMRDQGVLSAPAQDINGGFSHSSMTNNSKTVNLSLTSEIHLGSGTSQQQAAEIAAAHHKLIESGLRTATAGVTGGGH